MEKDKLNTLIKGNDGTCPNCHEFTQPIKNKHRLFCSECHIHLWEKPDSKTTEAPVSLKKALFLSLKKGFVFAVLWFPVWLVMPYFISLFHNEFQLFLFMVAILGIFFLIEKFISSSKSEQISYVCGVDKLEDFTSDNDESYKLIYGYRVPPCPECGSHRMANLYWFKRQFLKTETNTIPKISTDEKDFVGCLHCQSHYEIFPQKPDYTKLYIFIAVCVFGALLFLSFHEIIKLYISDKSILYGIGLFFGGWFFGLLTSLPKEKMNSEPLVKLKKQ